MNAISQEAKATFMMYAEDAPNWSGVPWVSCGNVSATMAMGGHLTDLARKGYIEIDDSDGDKCIFFTEAGVALAAEHGFKLEANA
jgi:hypothetical protein